MSCALVGTYPHGKMWVSYLSCPSGVSRSSERCAQLPPLLETLWSPFLSLLNQISYSIRFIFKTNPEFSQFVNFISPECLQYPLQPNDYCSYDDSLKVSSDFPSPSQKSSVAPISLRVITRVVQLTFRIIGKFTSIASSTLLLNWGWFPQNLFVFLLNDLIIFNE